jgi:hypothetical protein
MWEAIESNDIRLVEALLTNFQDNPTQGFTDSDLYDSNGQSMLHKCASLGHAEILMLFIERTGAKPDLVNA